MLASVSELYFAYGSNMSRARLIGRVPGAEHVGVARCDGYALRFDKPGRDGSAKANLAPAPDGVVWGVVWRIAAADWARLDACEPGYLRVLVAVGLGDEGLGDEGVRRQAHAYVYRGPAIAVPPLRAYLDHLLEGAREHGLPEDYRRALALLGARSR